MTVEPQKGIDPAEAEIIRKEEVVEIYAGLLDKIWQRSHIILGLVTIRAIMRRAIHLTSQQYPIIGEVSVDDRGLQLDGLRSRVGERNRSTIRQGFEELILTLFALLAELTSEAIVNKLFADELSQSRRK